jgi:RNA polymerase sigma-70 factor (ECF subfamily)
MDSDDETLVAQIREGSERAFNHLIDRHQQAVRGFLRRLMASAADADDIAQETFLAAWEGIGRYQGGSSVRSWLCAIAWRKAKTAQRSWFRSRARETDYETERVREGGGGEAPAEDRLAVKAALLTLPIDQRAAVALCLAEGFSHSEAAEALGAPLGTVKSHVTRGRARLLEVLSEIPASVSWQDGVEGVKR